MQNDERPGIAERVGKALARGNLRQREGPCELDVVTVLGLVGMTEKLADAVYRLKYANDHKSYHDAVDGVYGIARHLDARLRWRMRRRSLRWMAKRVLDYWLNDGCHLCTGVGYEVIHGSPHLSDRPCPQCHGSRKRVMPWVKRVPTKPEGRKATRAYRKRWKEVCRMVQDGAGRHRLLLVELENAERRIGERILTRLARAA